MQKISLIGILVLFTYLNGISSEILKLNWPQVTNYSNSTYLAAKQNWSISRDPKGNICFGNSAGLLLFNGQSWELKKLPQETIIRSVEIDRNGRIYIGSYEEFGYWEKDKYGNYHYFSLSDALVNYNFHNEEIWKIIIYKDTVFFQAFSRIFIYRNKEIKVLDPDGIISCLNRIEDNIYVHVNGKGLYTLKNLSLFIVNRSDFFINNRIVGIMENSREDFVIATDNQGLFLYNKETGAINPWGNTELFEKGINRTLKINDNLFVVGTILSGVYFFNSSGKNIHHISKENGLQNNTVLALYCNNNEELWIGLDNGIDLLHLNSELSYYKDNAGELGSAYTILPYNNFLYLGTNKGLFCSEISTSQNGAITKLNFRMIDNSQEQVWSLNEFENQVICGHNKGTFQVKKESIKKISDINGGLDIIEIEAPEGTVLIQSTYTNLVVFNRTNQSWNFSHVIEGFQHPVKYLEKDHLNNFWAGHFQKGLYRLRLNNDFTEVIETKYYGKNNGFRDDYNIKVFKFRNRIIFINNGICYTYDDLRDTIIYYPLPVDGRMENIYIKSIVPVNDEFCWLLSDQSLSLFKYKNNKLYLQRSFPYELFEGELIDNYEYILPIDTLQALVCMNEGISFIDIQQLKYKALDGHVQLHRIISSGKRNKYMKIEQDEKKFPDLDNDQNTIGFFYSYPEYSNEVQFKIKLDGLDTNWVYTKSNKQIYERLPAGMYTFHAAVADQYQNETLSTSWSFRIRPPFYRSVYAKIIYIILFLGFFMMIRIYYRRRLKVQELKLKQEKERAIIKLKNEALQSEVQQKSEQLADTTFVLSKKNELLMDIKKLLLFVRRTSAGNRREIARTIDIIERNISNDDEWKIFESNFEMAHKDFLRRMKHQYPQLTPGDLKLSAFLRMNLPSKKISSLLGISTRSVENHRYILRKKMNLEHDENLTEFIMNF